MAIVLLLRLVVLAALLVEVVLNARNATTAAPAPPMPTPPNVAPQPPPQQQQYSNPGALARLAKMFIDIPLGVVEAFKDGAEVIKTLVVAVMGEIFK